MRPTTAGLLLLLAFAAQVGAAQDIISGVPNYDQDLFPPEDPPSEGSDCVPVACAMLHGYYDSHGWPRLIPGGSNSVQENILGINAVVRKYKAECGYEPGTGVTWSLWNIWNNILGNTIVSVVHYFDSGASFSREDDDWTSFTRMQSYLNDDHPCVLAAFPRGSNDSYKWEGSSTLQELGEGHYVAAVGWSDSGGHWIICNMGWSYTTRAWFNYDGDDDWYVSQITPGGSSSADDYLRVDSPNGGETWSEGSQHTITWTSSGSPGSSVKLEYTLDGGSSWETIISSTPNDGSTTWTLPSVSATRTACKVRVTSTSKPYYYDESDSTFTITDSGPPPISLPEAVDQPTWTITTGGSANWFGQDSTYYYDSDAAQSGAISHNQESWMQTTVSGPASVSFYWKVSSESGYDYLEVYVDGTRQDRISGSVNWTQKTVVVSGTGSRTLKWRYMKDGSVNSGSDCGWVDKVVWTVAPHTVATPTTPTGPSSGATNTSYAYSTGGSSCSWGHSVEYQFDWGDGNQSSWGSASRSKSWSLPDTYTVKARARCASDTSVVSGWSGGKTVTIVYPPTLDSITPTSGPKCTYMKITGQNFGSSAGSVQFNGGTGTVSSWSDTTIYCRAPAGVATGGVFVRTAEGLDSNAATFTVTVPSIIHVNNTTNVPGIENGTVAYPFSAVQRGIDAASDGATVQVHQGTYVENIRFNGKAITVRSTNPDDPAVVADTIIDGNQAGSVVRFWSGEGPDSVLEGFTLQNGMASAGGGIWCSTSSPTIMKNVIIGNTAYYDRGWRGDGVGGGIYCSSGSPVIRNNVICGNTAGGTGLWSYGWGGGICLMWCVSAVLENNTIVGNSAVGELSTGGGVCCAEGSQLSIRNCIVRSNAADNGSEIALGGPLWSASGPLTLEYSNVRLGEEGVFLLDAESCTLTWGDGNIDVDPRFADPASGDYHLKSQAGRRDPASGWVTDELTSPCVDAGDPASEYANEPSPNGGRVNMGAYGNTAQASKSVPDPDIVSALPPSGPITTYMKIEGSWFGVAEGTVEIGGTNARILSWTDTEILCRVEPGTASGLVVVRRLNGVESNPAPFTVTAPEIVYVDDDNTSGIENGTLTWPFSKVQRGVDAAVETATIHTVIAARGTYVENVDFRGEDITVRSTDPDDPAVVADTIIDGNQDGSAVTFNSGEGADSILMGFTIRGGSGTDHFGGGIHCDGTSPLIEKNRIIGNTVHFHGGGVYCKGGSPTIRNNLIAGNLARWFGAGVVCWDSTATVAGNVIRNNAAHWYGGGIFAHGPAAPTIKNNVVYDNSGSEGAGIACIYQCSPLIENNTVATNAAERAGGGVYAAWDCSPTLKNMIVWDNTAPGGPQIALAEDSSSEVTYSDVQGGEALVSVGSGCTLTWGDGNVDLLPLFASLTDFHLQSTGGRYLPSSGLPPEDPAAWVADGDHSPCIDTGDPTSVYAAELAPNGSRINMGAYGNTAQASKSGVGASLAVGSLRSVEDAPRIVATSPVLGSRTYSPTQLTLTFDRAVNVGASAVEIYGWQTGAHPGYRLTYDVTGHTVHLEWPTPLPADAYEVRVIADAILSADGNMALDGEVNDPTDPESLPSGDGTPGGDAYMEFEVTRRRHPKSRKGRSPPG